MPYPGFSAKVWWRGAHPSHQAETLAARNPQPFIAIHGRVLLDMDEVVFLSADDSKVAGDDAMEQQDPQIADGLAIEIRTAFPGLEECNPALHGMELRADKDKKVQNILRSVYYLFLFAVLACLGCFFFGVQDLCQGEKRWVRCGLRLASTCSSEPTTA